MGSRGRSIWSTPKASWNKHCNSVTACSGADCNTVTEGYAGPSIRLSLMKVLTAPAMCHGPLRLHWHSPAGRPWLTRAQSTRQLPAPRRGAGAPSLPPPVPLLSPLAVSSPLFESTIHRQALAVRERGIRCAAGRAAAFLSRSGSFAMPQSPTERRLAVRCDATPALASARNSRSPLTFCLKACRSGEFAHHARRKHDCAVPLLQKSHEH